MFHFNSRNLKKALNCTIICQICFYENSGKNGFFLIKFITPKNT